MFAAPDLEALTQLTIRVAMGRHFFIPILRRGGRVMLPGVVVRGLWAFTLRTKFVLYRPYPLSVPP